MKKEKKELESQTWPKLKESIKFKDLIKHQKSLIDLFKDLIKEKIKFESQLRKN
jgi:hypothetical protein